MLEQMKQGELLDINGGVDTTVVAEGFGVVCGTIIFVCEVTAGAAATAAVTTIAAPIVAVGVLGAVAGGAIMAYGFNK